MTHKAFCIKSRMLFIQTWPLSRQHTFPKHHLRDLTNALKCADLYLEQCHEAFTRHMEGKDGQPAAGTKDSKDVACTGAGREGNAKRGDGSLQALHVVHLANMVQGVDTFRV
jgi:hypothetical protein